LKGFTNVFKGVSTKTVEEWDGTNWNYAQNSPLVKDFNFGSSIQVMCPAGN